MSAEIPLEQKIALLEQRYELSSKTLKELKYNSSLSSESERKQHLQLFITTVENELTAVKNELAQFKKSLEPATLHNVPQLPKDLVEYSKIFDELKTQLLKKTTGIEMSNGQRTPLLISAPDGTGKSTMAVRLARDEEIEKKFFDGIFWIRLGEKPNILSLQMDIARALSESMIEFVDSEAASEYLSQLCTNRKCLLILDDVCNVQDINVFNILGKEGQLVMTTAEKHLVDFAKYILPHTEEYSLKALSEEYAEQYFMKCANKESAPVSSAVKDIVRACECLPLALKMTASAVWTMADPNWDKILSSLKEVNCEEFPSDHPESLMRTLSVCIDSLGEEPAEYYLALSVFADYTRIPQSTIVMLWEYLYHLKEDQAYHFINKFIDRGLLHINGASPKSYVSLHNFQHEYLSFFADEDKLHVHLLAAYRRHCREHGWIKGPNDGYFFEYVCQHLLAAGRKNELKPLLLDFDWLRNKLQASTLYALLSDYEVVQDAVVNLVKKALFGSASILLDDKNKLATILLDELWEEEKKSKDITALLNQAREVATDWKPPYAGQTPYIT